jgi:cell division protein ZapA (FtsZ GTPase activity inhibitor)
MPVQTTSFRNLSPSSKQLEELILIELAIRDQAGLDERRKPLPSPRESHEFIANVRTMAREEGWRVEQSAVDDAVQRLTEAHQLVTDRDPRVPKPDGCSARLRAQGYARAAGVARQYLNGPLQSFQLDGAFNGIGQVLVDFLGERFVIGCIEGEEDRAIRYADRFEIDSGEVVKAVPGDVDSTRAMLMAGVLAHQQIEELEARLESVPASDRIVTVDHNAPNYAETIEALEHLIDVIRENNRYREDDEADQERRVSELAAGRRLLDSRWISVASVRAALWGTLTYLASKFMNAPIGDAASLAWSALKKLLGLS